MAVERDAAGEIVRKAWGSPEKFRKDLKASNLSTEQATADLLKHCVAKRQQQPGFTIALGELKEAAVRTGHILQDSPEWPDIYLVRALKAKEPYFKELESPAEQGLEGVKEAKFTIPVMPAPKQPAKPPAKPAQAPAPPKPVPKPAAPAPPAAKPVEKPAEPAQGMLSPELDHHLAQVVSTYLLRTGRGAWGREKDHEKFSGMKERIMEALRKRGAVSVAAGRRGEEFVGQVASDPDMMIGGEFLKFHAADYARAKSLGEAAVRNALAYARGKAAQKPEGVRKLVESVASNPAKAIGFALAAPHVEKYARENQGVTEDMILTALGKAHDAAPSNVLDLLGRKPATAIRLALKVYEKKTKG